MSGDLKQRTAELYLSAYNNYMDVCKQQENLLEQQQACHKTLCEAAQLFLEIDESEMTRILFYWDSIAKDAKDFLGVE